MLGIDADGLEETINKMNHYAETGKDEDFGRGDSAYDRFFADHAFKPTPCLEQIVKAPFYALRIEAGDFGTLGGLDTDTSARVKKADGGVFEGYLQLVTAQQQSFRLTRAPVLRWVLQ